MVQPKIDIVSKRTTDADCLASGKSSATILPEEISADIIPVMIARIRNMTSPIRTMSLILALRCDIIDLDCGCSLR